MRGLLPQSKLVAVWKRFFLSLRPSLSSTRQNHHDHFDMGTRFLCKDNENRTRDLLYIRKVRFNHPKEESYH